MLTDKEVGELWRESLRHSRDCVFTAKVQLLILKLVEEAQEVYRAKYGTYTGIHEDAIFKRFGIDPDEFYRWLEKIKLDKPF